MKVYGNSVTHGGGYGGDHKTPLPSLKFREKPKVPESPTKLRFPSDIPEDKVRNQPVNPRKGKLLGPRSDLWVNPRALLKEQVDMMVELYEDGWTMGTIAVEVGCSRPTVVRYLNERGVRIRSTRKEIDMDYVNRRYIEGASLNQIGREVGVSGQTISSRLKKLHGEI